MSRKASRRGTRFLDPLFAQPLLGIDEVGTGCIAGPIYAAGVMLPDCNRIRDTLFALNLRDSKKMSPPARERVCNYLLEQKVYMIVESVSSTTIDKCGQAWALRKLYTAIMGTYRGEVLSGDILLDGLSRKDLRHQHKGLVRADDQVLAVAAASVIAKVTRDRYMAVLGFAFPQYGWGSNSGYSTPAHLQALWDHGPTQHHRHSTKPVKRANAVRESLQEADDGG